MFRIVMDNLSALRLLADVDQQVRLQPHVAEDTTATVFDFEHVFLLRHAKIPLVEPLVLDVFDEDDLPVDPVSACVASLRVVPVPSLSFSALG